jgi:hypothetical protein
MKKQEYVQLFEQQATKRSGIVKKGIFGGLRLNFSYRNTNILIHPYLGGELEFTDLTKPNIIAKIKYRAKKRFLIWVLTRNDENEKCFNEMQQNSTKDGIPLNLKIGNPEFDEQYITAWYQEQPITGLITNEIQKKLINYRTHYYNEWIVLFSGGQLEIKMSNIPEDDKQFDLFIEIIKLFYDRLVELNWIENEMLA